MLIALPGPWGFRPFVIEDHATMTTERTLEELQDLVGQQLGISDWLTVDQPMIDAFAQVSGDHQFIHVDPERAR